MFNNTFEKILGENTSFTTRSQLNSLYNVRNHFFSFFFLLVGVKSPVSRRYMRRHSDLREIIYTYFLLVYLLRRTNSVKPNLSIRFCK